MLWATVTSMNTHISHYKSDQEKTFTLQEFALKQFHIPNLLSASQTLLT